MQSMFLSSDFNNYSLKDWNVSNVKNMSYMFYSSIFNGDLSNWDVSNVNNMYSMFQNSKFNNNSLKDWNLSNVSDLKYMFAYSNFCGDISNWNLKENVYCSYIIFSNSDFINKYNYDNGYESKQFIKWFERNRGKIKEINQGTKEEILDFFSFNKLDFQNNLN